MGRSLRARVGAEAALAGVGARSRFRAPGAEPSAAALLAARILALTTPGAKAGGEGGAGPSSEVSWGGGEAARSRTRRGGGVAPPPRAPWISCDLDGERQPDWLRAAVLREGRGRESGGGGVCRRWSGSVDAYRPLYVVLRFAVSLRPMIHLSRQ